MPYLDTRRWLFVAVALGGIAVTIYARLDDWRRGAAVMWACLLFGLLARPLALQWRQIRSRAPH